MGMIYFGRVESGADAAQRLSTLSTSKLPERSVPSDSGNSVKDFLRISTLLPAATKTAAFVADDRRAPTHDGKKYVVYMITILQATFYDNASGDILTFASCLSARFSDFSTKNVPDLEASPLLLPPPQPTCNTVRSEYCSEQCFPRNH